MPEDGKASGAASTAVAPSEKVGQRAVRPPRRSFLSLRIPLSFGALQHRNFQLFYSGQVISLTGGWIQRVAQGWLVLELTDSPLMLGVVGFANAAPVLLLSLFAGVIVDRVDKRSLLVVTQVGAMFCAFVLAFLTQFGLIEVWHVIAIAVLLGLVMAFDGPVRQSFVVEMVGKQDLMNAIALNSTAFNGARILGPSIAGVIVATVGIALCFWINAITFIPVIVGLLLMRLQSHSNDAQQRPSTWTSLVEGFRYMQRQRVVRSILILMGTGSLFATPYLTLMPVFARDVLRAGPEGYGYLMAAAGLGAFVGSLTLVSLSGFRHKGMLLTAGNLLLPVAVLAFAASRWYWLAALTLVITGFALVIQNATSNTVLQIMVPDELRGRVMSAFMWMGMGLFPLGSLLAGAVAEYMGAPLALALGAVICGVLAMAVFWRVPELRKVE